MKNRFTVCLSIIIMIMILTVSCNKKQNNDNVVQVSSTQTSVEDSTVYCLGNAEYFLSSAGALGKEDLLERDVRRYHDLSDIEKGIEAVGCGIRLVDHSYAGIEVYYIENPEKSINVEVEEAHISATEIKPLARITIRLNTCTVEVSTWVDDDTTIILPPEVETELRYILSI